MSAPSDMKLSVRQGEAFALALLYHGRLFDHLHRTTRNALVNKGLAEWRSGVGYVLTEAGLAARQGCPVSAATLTPRQREALLRAHRHNGVFDRELRDPLRSTLITAGLAWSSPNGYVLLTEQGRALARREFAADDAAWDPIGAPAVGQVWRHKRDERQDLVRDMRVEAVVDRYVYCRGAESGRQSRILRGTGRRTGPSGYRLLSPAGGAR